MSNMLSNICFDNEMHMYVRILKRGLDIMHFNYTPRTIISLNIKARSKVNNKLNRNNFPKIIFS